MKAKKEESIPRVEQKSIPKREIFMLSWECGCREEIDSSERKMWVAILRICSA